LYQELELFATSDARGDATVVMGESAVSQLSDADWKKLALLLPLSDAETASLPALSRGKRPVGLDLAASEEDLLAEDDVEEEEDDEEEEDEDDNEDEYGPGSAAYAAELKAEEKANAKFCSEWLNVAVRSIVALLLRQVLEIPRLDECGAAQLITDLDYFSNVSSYLATYLPTYLPQDIFFSRWCSRCFVISSYRCSFFSYSPYLFLLLARRPILYLNALGLRPPTRAPQVTSALGLPRHALVQHVVALTRLSREDYSKALARPKPAAVANAFAAAAQSASAAKLAHGGGAAGAGVMRKFERQYASVRGMAVVFGED
jgi:hypothetical protein